ncbi:MAG: hypothetical protein ACJARP_002306 [Vicingaceae bacterium]
MTGRNYIEKSRLFLEKIAQIDLSDLDKNWVQIKKMQKIRNAIAHDYSYINGSSDSNKDIINFLKKHNSIEFDDEVGSFYCKDEELVIELIETIRTYLKEVCNKLKVRYFKKPRQAITASIEKIELF